MQQSIIKAISDLVEDACRMETNVFGYTYWTHHILKVVEFGRILAERLSADYEIVHIAALLHDYAKVLTSEYVAEHQYYGAIEAEKALRQLNYAIEKIETVKDCISLHRGSRSAERKTKEAVCLASADAMAHITQIPSMLYSAYARRNMTIDDGANWLREKIERSWNKLCPEAKEIVKDRYKAALLILDKAPSS